MRSKPPLPQSDRAHTLLQNVPLFASLNNEQRRTVSRAALIKSFPRNSVILREGDKTDCIYVIHSGKVKVLMSDGEGREVILSILREGEFFGEMALIDEQPRSATVVTMEESQVSVISKADFNDCLTRHPKIAMSIMQGLAKRLRGADMKIESLALLDVYGRMVRTLVQLAEPHEGRLVISEKLSQQEIANMIGASREMVSRIMRDLAVEGYITIEAKHIILNQKLPGSW